MNHRRKKNGKKSKRSITYTKRPACPSGVSGSGVPHANCGIEFETIRQDVQKSVSRILEEHGIK